MTIIQPGLGVIWLTTSWRGVRNKSELFSDWLTTSWRGLRDTLELFWVDFLVLDKEDIGDNICFPLRKGFGGEKCPTGELFEQTFSLSTKRDNKYCKNKKIYIAKLHRISIEMYE